MRLFDRVIAKEVARGTRYDYPFSLVVIDISELGSLHEQCSFLLAHRGLIRSIAGILKQNIRSADILVRSGPSQFLILMPESDRNAALRLIDRLQQLLNAWCAEQGLLDRD